MNRWVFLSGSAVIGLLLYLVFKVNHPDAAVDGPAGFSGPVAGGRENRWNTLVPPELPSPGRASHSEGGEERSANREAPEPRVPSHPLDSSSTIYLDGAAPENAGSQAAERSPTGPDVLLLSAIKSLLGGAPKSGGAPLISGLAGVFPPAQSGAGGGKGPRERNVAAGSELSVVILKTVEGPGAQMPVVARIRQASLARFHLPEGTKIMGFPEGMGPNSRLRIRFTRILYPGGFETQTTGFALSGGREGVPVELSRHTGSNIAKSLAQNSMMLGGEAVGSLGWSGTDPGTMMAMQEGGMAMDQAGSQLPPPIAQPGYRLESGTSCTVMVMESFPVPGPGGRP